VKSALVLLDLRSDLLAREGLAPVPPVLVDGAARLLETCRRSGLGGRIVHVHTRVEASAALAPERLRPAPGEPLLAASGASAFDGRLDALLREREIEGIILAGLDLEGAVRATALDAADRGLAVVIAADAVGSTEPEQAEMARLFLEGRIATFQDGDAVRLDPGLAARGVAARGGAGAVGEEVPPAWIGGEWDLSDGGAAFERRNPSDWRQVLAQVAAATPVHVRRAVLAATEARLAWEKAAPARRTCVLEAWAAALQARADAIAASLAREVGKPVADGREEVRAAAALVLAASRRVAEAASANAGSALARRRPLGVVGLITPWNNPVAIPVGKLAPALAFGNAVVWKPSPAAPRTAMTVCETLAQSGVEPGLVNLVFGEAEVARHLIDHPEMAAVSMTGSTVNGRAAAVRCLRRGIPLQAELGGNNAAIVLEGCDLSAEAPAMALAAFSFAGQRCTAISRFVVVRPMLAAFLSALAGAVARLRLGDPRDPATQIGPLVSRASREWVRSRTDDAVRAGARVCATGTVPAGLEHGCWMEPVVLGEVHESASIARTEVFGPVAVVLPARGLDDAIRIANGVEHGLVGALYGGSDAERRRFTDAIQAGVVNLRPGPLRVDPEAPFGGWKASGIGPPEHGIWDERFYARPQAVYAPNETGHG
jgi:acyl-CoA reductase-like NAD-dependent aldehyde dehydrogenase/nicotinamidase-related amidase